MSRAASRNKLVVSQRGEKGYVFVVKTGRNHTVKACHLGERAVLPNVSARVAKEAYRKIAGRLV
jgi:hypothetical protein